MSKIFDNILCNQQICTDERHKLVMSSPNLTFGTVEWRKIRNKVEGKYIIERKATLLFFQLLCND